MKPYDHLRNTLREYHVDVDTETLWNKTAHAIPRKKKRRFAFFFLAGAGCLLLSTVIYMISAVPETPSAKPQVTSGQEPVSVVPAPSDQILNIPNPNSQAERGMHADPKTLSIPRTGPQSPDRPFSNRQDLATSSNVDNPTAHPAYESSAPEPASIPRSAGAYVDTNDQAPHVSVADHQAEIVSQSHHTVDTGNHGTGIIPIPTQETPANVIIPFLQTIPFEMLDGEPEPDHISEATPQIEPLKRKPSFYVLAFQGAGASGIRIKAVDTESQPAADLLNKTMQSLEYTATGGYGVFRFPGGFEVGGGLRYRRQITRIQYDWTQSSRTTGTGPSMVIIDEQGSRQYIDGQIGVTAETTFRSTRFTQHSAVDLSLFLSPTIVKGPTWEAGPFAEAGYNVFFGSAGTSFNAANQLIGFTRHDSPFKSAGTWTWGAGLHIRYKTLHRFSAFARIGVDGLRYRQTDAGQLLHISHTTGYLAIGGSLHL